MALSASDLPAMYNLLANSLSGDERLRKPAEAALAQSESRPGFCSCLMEVITAKDLASQVDVRLMASLYFKNSINRYWRNRRDSSGIGNEEKKHLRQKLLSHLREENYQIALTLAVLISKIARIDYPKEWPELFSVLAQQLPSADILTSHRIFMILFRTLKELSTKRLASDQKNFAEISSHFFDYSWHLWQSDLQTILHGFSLFSQNLSSNASDLRHDDLYLTCERWLLCVKIIRQLIISGFPSDAKSIQEVRPVKEVSPALLNAIQSFLPYYSSFREQHPKFWDFLKRACTKLVKVLVAVQSRHPYSFGDKSVLPPVMDFCLNKITDPEPDVMSFEQFLIQCMKLVKSVLECKEYKPSLTGRVMDENGVTLEQMKKNVSSVAAGVVTSLLPSDRVVLLCNVLIRRYFVLTATDLEVWYHSVPEFFANFTDLTVLSLSSSNLEGQFPEKIFQVPTLQTLDLGNNRFLNGSLPEFLQNGSLQRLVLSNTNFSGRLPDSIGNLRNLSRVELSVCNFSGPIPNSMANLSHLVYLDFSSNNFTGPIPSFQMSKNLTYIDFSHNALTGPVPSSYFEGFSNLVNVDLAYNSFNESIPLSLFYLPSLQKILLSNNQFGGQVAGLKNRSLSPLDTLDLSSNKLEGPIPSYFFDFGRLDILSLSFNHFSGTLQLERIRSLQNLTKLDLSYNNLSINASGSSSSLSSFPHLSMLRLASCKLQKFPPPMNLSRTIYLDLSDNQISGEIPDWIWNITSGNLMYLNLSCNLLVGMLRQYSFTSLNVIDLHSNQLHGEIPIPSQSVIYVDYSSNNFYSSIPAEIGNNLTFAIFFSLSNNNLTGVIPLSICNSINLQVLDLSINRLSGTIPKCLIESRSATLGVLNLRNNNLTGNILGTFPESCALETLDFNRNHLEGHVPQSLTNCAKLEVLNLGNNNINDNFTCFLKNSSHLRVLNLRSNRFQGGIDCEGEQKNSWPKLQIIDLALNNFSGFLPQDCFLHWKAMMVDGGNAQSKLNHLHFKFLEINPFYYHDTVTVTIKGQQLELVKILTVFTSIDFSNNIFHGEIPYTVGALKYLYVLNLSHNFLTGDIPRSLGNLTQLESLDLSMNKLSGSIPEQLASLTFLSFLNLSFNRLVGRIPIGTQIQSFSETSFKGNEGLCGAPLNTCIELIPSTTPISNESGSSLMTEFDWEVIYTGVGFGIGAGLLVGLLMFWEQGSHWCDKHIENFAWMILPTLGFIFSCCNDGKVESEGNIENPLDETGDSDEDEDATEDKAFTGQYCVFCSKLDICWEKVIHNPKCRCHESPPISTSSSFSSSSSS